MMTVPQITRGIRMRKHAWGKPTQQIADEAGVHHSVINAVLKEQGVSPAAYALLTSYLRTPAGPWAMINNRHARASATGARAALERKVRRLSVMAIGFDLRVMPGSRMAQLTTGELKAYYWRLDWRVKERIIAANRDVTGRFVIPDSLEAWEWIERITLLRERLTISGSIRRPGTAAPRPVPSTAPPQPCRSRSRAASWSRSAGAT